MVIFFLGFLFGLNINIKGKNIKDYAIYSQEVKNTYFDLLVIKEILRLNFREGSTLFLFISVLPLQRIYLMWYLHAYTGH